MNTRTNNLKRYSDKRSMTLNEDRLKKKKTKLINLWTLLSI